jgi:hypothetical protein
VQVSHLNSIFWLIYDRGAWRVEDLPDASRGSLNPKFKVEFDYFGLAPLELRLRGHAACDN